MTSQLPKLLALLILCLFYYDPLRADGFQSSQTDSRIRRLPPVVATNAGAEVAAPQQLPAGITAAPIESARTSNSAVTTASWTTLSVVGEPAAEEIPAPVVVPAEPALQLNDVVDSVYATFPLLQVAFRERQVAAGRALAARGAFDTHLEAGALEEPMGFYKNYRHYAGITQGLWSGADVYGGYRIGRGVFPPWYQERVTDESGEFKLGVSIPLLQGRAIDKRRAEVLKAQVARRAVEPAIQSQLIRFVQSGSHAYWDWVAAGQNYRVAESLLDIALERDRGLRGRVQRGDLAEIELVDNERLIVSRRAKLIQADRKLQQSAIKLSLWLRSPEGIPSVPDVQLLPGSFPVPLLPEPVEMGGAADLALSLRPELNELSLAVREMEIELAQAQNQFLPDVSVGLAAAKDIGPEASPKGDKRPFQLEASLLADVPLQRRTARGRVQTAQAKLAQLNGKRRFTADKVVAEVRDAVSALRMAMDQVQQARQSVELARRMQDAEQRKFNLGTSDLLLVNLREQAAADAAQTEVDALAEFFKAEVDFRAAIGAELTPVLSQSESNEQESL